MRNNPDVRAGQLICIYCVSCCIGKALILETPATGISADRYAMVFAVISGQVCYAACCNDRY